MCNYLKTGLVFLLFYALGSSVLSQELILKSKILDNQTGETLPFANIMLLGHTIGTTADIGGSFYLVLSEQNRNDTLVISYMGYHTKKVVVSEVKHEGVLLNSKSFQLETFQFFSGGRKTVILNPFRNKDCFIPYDNTLSSDNNYWFPYRPQEPAIQAIYFPSTGPQNEFIKEVWVHTHTWSLPARFRLRLFQTEENLIPGSDLITENLIIEVTQRDELLKINLENHHLILPENGVFIGLELMIMPENKHIVTLPDGSDSVTLYSPFLSFFPTRDENDTYWVFTGGRWKENQLELYPEHKSKGYLPAISLVIEQ